MNKTERQALRAELLEELYAYYFTNGRGQQISMRDLNQDIEKRFAYQYLADKGLIAMNSINGILYHFKITAEGIDAVERSAQSE
ncbi:hypothetical protein BEP19_13340 [Ammoniphilus oxalaticus]|uniref:Uncharacterized protein n=1 Tax=Ammoniphilus oxalaticus TaxID=66863 RepID=A0A419SHI5_9BACL|nr:hypothetical protein [Ammoniphilus oxalaticus]RKD23195.1 hypothetical protein BEP19_13340 [Ammoniphilus oxalaticus]